MASVRRLARTSARLVSSSWFLSFSLASSSCRLRESHSARRLRTLTTTKENRGLRITAPATHRACGLLTAARWTPAWRRAWRFAPAKETKEKTNLHAGGGGGGRVRRRTDREGWEGGAE